MAAMGCDKRLSRLPNSQKCFFCVEFSFLYFCRCGVPDQTKEPNATDMASAGIHTDGTSNTNATDQIEDISNFSGDNGALSSNNPSVSRKRRDVPDVNPLDVVRLNIWNKAEATLRDKEKEMISEAEPPIKSR